MIKCQIQKQLHSGQEDFLLDVKFDLLEKEILAITGPSGSGKTTLLRLLAGLEKPENGQIIFKNSIWVDVKQKLWVPPQKRSIGMVFQNYALFPNMTIKENLSYALAKPKETDKVDEMLSILDLVALADKHPQQLSGGQQQRVALGRSIITQPDVLLLDEPLSALDQNFREQMQMYLLMLHQEYDFSMIIVSHNQQEIYTLADRIATLEKGKLSILANKPIQTWENIQNNGAILEAKVIRFTSKKTGDYIILLIGDNMIELPYSIDSNLQVGQRIKLSMSNPLLNNK